MANITDENRLVVTLTLADFKNALLDVLICNNYLNEPQDEPQIKSQEIKSLVPRLLVATTYNVCPETIDKWVKLGIFPKPVKQGGRKYFYQSDLDSFNTVKTKNTNS
jgi:predicted DNA-binding transcriptional regulator AlpA